MSEADPLLVLQAAIATRLSADVWMTPPAPAKPVAVLTENQGDLESLIAQAVGSLGVCATVLTPSGRLDVGDKLGVVLDPADVVIQISEEPLLNRGANGTGKTALEVVVRVMRLLHGWTVPDRRGSRKLARLTLRPDAPFRLVSSDGSIEYLVNAQVRVNLGAPLALAPEILGEDGGRVSGEDGGRVKGD